MFEFGTLAIYCLGVSDRVAAARAELEKANARMFFEIRLVLTPDPWRTLQDIDTRGMMTRPPNR